MKKNRNKETVTFKEAYEQKKKLKEINECSWFGILAGLFLSFTGLYHSLCTVDVVCLLFKLLTALGFLFTILGSFFPLILKWLLTGLNKAFSFIGNIIIRCLIFPIYLIMMFINLLFGKKYSKRFNFLNWKDAINLESTFSEFSISEHKKHKFATLDIINNVFSYFLNNRMYIIIPLVFILILFGLVIFFASSNAVFSFVYTLF